MPAAKKVKSQPTRSSKQVGAEGAGGSSGPTAEEIKQAEDARAEAKAQAAGFKDEAKQAVIDNDEAARQG